MLFTESIVTELSIPSTPESTKPLSENRYRIEILAKDEGFIRSYNLGADSGIPIKSLDFTLTRNGCGISKVNFATIDFPLQALNLIRVYRDGERIYSGFFKDIPHLSGGTASVSPFLSRLSDTKYNGSFVAQTIAYILETMITANVDKTQILWNASSVDTGSVATKTITYDYKTAKDIIEDFIKDLNNRYYGVDADNFFYIKQYETDITQYFFKDDESYFIDFDAKEQNSGIKYTRLQVYQKNAGAGTESRLGQVGYDAPGGSYPIVTRLEDKVGIIEDKITVPEGLVLADALDYAYYKITSQSTTQNINIKGIDDSKYNLKIGQKARIYEFEEIQFNIIIGCDALNDLSGSWRGMVALDSTYKYRGDYSIKYDSSNPYCYYQFDGLRKWKSPYKIGFMFYCNKSNQLFEICLANSSSLGGYSSKSASTDGGYSRRTDLGGTELFDPSYTYRFSTQSNGWFFIDFDITKDDFDVIGIRKVYGVTAGTILYIDTIGLYQYTRNYYDGNIIQIDYQISKDKTNINAVIGELERPMTENELRLESKVDRLEETSKV